MSNLTREKLFAEFIFNLLNKNKDIIYLGTSPSNAKIVLDNLIGHYSMLDKFENCSIIKDQIKGLDLELVNMEQKMQQVLNNVPDDVEREKTAFRNQVLNNFHEQRDYQDNEYNNEHEENEMEDEGKETDIH